MSRIDRRDRLESGSGKDELRFVVCGSADDGKSTLLGLLPHDSGTIPDDEFGAVACRCFATEKRKFIAVDAPGHEQYTRNLVAGASDADLAVVLVDARKGVLTQTRRHGYIVSLMRIRRAILAVNKMDLVDYDEGVFSAIVGEFEAFAAEVGIEEVSAVPVSALTGENILAAGGSTPWYGGPTLMELLETVDIGRGDMIAEEDRAPEVADQFAAHIVWMDEQPMLPERRYSIRFASASAVAQITDLTHRIDVDTLGRMAAKTLELNEIGYCKLSLDRRVPFDAHADNRRTGAFVLIDRFTDATVGAGVIGFALRRASNVVWRDMKVDKAARARAIGQQPCVLWLTGLSAAGKSTIADRVERKLRSLGRHTYLLDGDNVRHGLSRDLGFTDRDRVENIRRVAEVAKLMVDAGLIVIVSFISPFRAEREMARAMVEEGEFVEIFVRRPHRCLRGARSEGAVREGPQGRSRQLHRDRFTIRAAAKPRPAHRHDELSPDEAADEVLRLLGTRGSGITG